MPAFLSFPHFCLMGCEHKRLERKKPPQTRGQQSHTVEAAWVADNHQAVCMPSFLSYETHKLNTFKPQLNEAFLLSVAEFNLYWYFINMPCG